MTKLSLVVLTAALGFAGAAAPALAAPTTADSVPYCSTGNSQDLINKQKDALATQLSLSQGVSSIDVWNGCFKVMTTAANGKTTVAFYDPDSLKLVDTLGSSSVGLAG